MKAQNIRPDDLVLAGGHTWKVLRVQRKRGSVRLWLFAPPHLLRILTLRFDQDLACCYHSRWQQLT